MNYRPGSKFYVFDLETLGQPEDSIIVSAAFLVFDFKENKTFEQLLDDTFYTKFSIKEQKELGRTISKDTLAWWQTQDPEVKKELMPSKADKSLRDGSDAILEYLESKGIGQKSRNVFRFCRGQDFDIPMMEHAMKSVNRSLPGEFWNSRDIRTFISSMIMDMGQSTVYKDGREYKTLKGFKKHDARHDVAKAVLELVNVCRLATGEMEASDL